MPLQISLKLSEKSKSFLRKFPESFEKGFYKGIQESMYLAEKEAKKNAPVKTGTLRRSIRSEVEEKGLDTIGSLFSNLIYAPVIEFGFKTRRNINLPKPFMEPALRDNLVRFSMHY